MLIFFQNCTVSKKEVRFEIKKESPAIGLTLGWSLPEVALQKIVGNKFKPFAKDGKGFLMLFIATTPTYYLNDAGYNNLMLAHIVIPVEGKNTINAPLSIVPKNQKINKALQQFGFKMEVGDIKMNMVTKKDSISIGAQIITATGSINFYSTFLNNPGETKKIDHTTVTATNNTNSSFSGPESYKSIGIPSIKIEHSGKNWITQLGLTEPPMRVWLNIDFVWDFMFMKK